MRMPPHSHAIVPFLYISVFVFCFTERVQSCVQDALIQVSPGYVRERQGITVSFELCDPSYGIDNTLKTQIYVRMSGFTSGNCNNIRGVDIKTLPMENTSTYFISSWEEGNVQNEFSDSYLILTATDDFVDLRSYKVKIDGIAGIRLNCAGNYTYANDKNLTIWRSNALLTEPTAARLYPDIITGSCYVTNQHLSFGQSSEPIFTNTITPRNSEINLTMTPAMTLNPGDKILITLSGFTSGNRSKEVNGLETGNIRNLMIYDRFRNFLLSRGQYLINPAYTRANASWTEGCCLYNGQPGMHNSTLTINVLESIPAGTKLDFLVHAVNGIQPVCGIPENYSLFSLKIVDSDNTIVVPKTSIPSDVIGSCPNDCSGHGTCDYCMSTCSCDPGYGSRSDIGFKNMARDCSELACPVGPSWAATPKKKEEHPSNVSSASSIGNYHYDAECSGVGTCNRNTGLCNCGMLFTGRACENSKCPGTTEPCSGQGTCFSMEHLALQDAALPLNDMNYIPDYNSSLIWINQARGYHYTDSEGNDNQAWDARSIYGCICDSSWEVGLEANVTQSPEFFGVDCSLRHCPSGDDPSTESIDETDCSEKEAIGFRGIGEPGNLCHVDCSNKGSCDYSTGLCTCFSGWYGANCGLRVKY